MGKLNTRESVLEEFAGFNNGHSEYMIKGVTLDEFLDFAEKSDELIGGVQKGNGVIYFTMCEKGYPEYTDVVAAAFPDAMVYGTAAWDGAILVCISSARGIDTSIHEYKREELPFTVSVDECFDDEGNIRIDLQATDKETGDSIYYGDLFCFDSAEEVRSFKDDEDCKEMLKWCPELEYQLDEAIEGAIRWHEKRSDNGK